MWDPMLFFGQIGQNDNVTIRLEIAQLWQVVVNRISHILQVNADGVADADTTDGIQVKLDGGTCSAVLSAW